MLPVDPSAGRSQGLDPHTCTLLRKLAALPAIIDRHGWHRPLSVPAMVQLGYYPGGRGARYRPHLDRWANEVSNRRELTFIVYVNCGWDAERHGGHLRLHTDPNDLNGRGEGTIDVEPIAGRGTRAQMARPRLPPPFPTLPWHPFSPSLAPFPRSPHPSPPHSCLLSLPLCVCGDASLTGRALPHR